VSDQSNPRSELLRRLLGPAGPELTCEQCFEDLDRYVELELRQDETRADELIPGMRAHLEGCEACAEEHASLRALVRDDDSATLADGGT
jgi:anti-sigma factor RsiW